MLFIRKRDIYKEAQDILETYYEDIVKELQIPKIPVYIREGFCSKKKSYLGVLNYRHEEEIHPRSNIPPFIRIRNFMPHNSFIEIFPLAHLYNFTRKKLIPIRDMFLTRSEFRKSILETIAHELRHTYQIFDVDRRLREKDAKAWSKYYVNKKGRV